MQKLFDTKYKWSQSLKMEEIQLNESEQRYFGDLFACYDSENTGKIAISKAAELFRSANIPLEVLKQVGYLLVIIPQRVPYGFAIKCLTSLWYTLVKYITYASL